jgi:hypothetical protein
MPPQGQGEPLNVWSLGMVSAISAFRLLDGVPHVQLWTAYWKHNRKPSTILNLALGEVSNAIPLNDISSERDVSGIRSRFVSWDLTVLHLRPTYRSPDQRRHRQRLEKDCKIDRVKIKSHRFESFEMRTSKGKQGFAQAGVSTEGRHSKWDICRLEHDFDGGEPRQLHRCCKREREEKETLVAQSSCRSGTNLRGGCKKAVLD